LATIVVPAEVRGAYLGLTITVGSLCFVGAAPLAVSSISDLLGGQAMLAEALAIVCSAASALGAVVFAYGIRQCATPS